ncbi:MAG TPA: hypothetical protein VF178_16005, partial [Gemmatimonadaceae bacterium]
GFFVVSDRHDDTIFRLEFEDDRACAVVAVRFTGPEPYPERGFLDLEGVTPAPDGGFFVVAEWGFAVAHVPWSGGRATWVTPDVRALGATVGLFATRDAHLEGLAVLGGAEFLLAAERQPRGLITVHRGERPTLVAAQRLDETKYPLPAGRRPDFADLCVWRGRVFALARNQHLVVELERNSAGAWSEGAAWSYAATENAAPHRFADMTFGLGEGLAIDDRFIYVLLDNNAMSRAHDAQDRRTWLFAFEHSLDDES